MKVYKLIMLSLLSAISFACLLSAFMWALMAICSHSTNTADWLSGTVFAYWFFSFVGLVFGIIIFGAYVEEKIKDII